MAKKSKRGRSQDRRPRALDQIRAPGAGYYLISWASSVPTGVGAPGRGSSPHGSHSNTKLGQHCTDTERVGHFAHLRSLCPNLQNRSSFWPPKML
jgi:hypothetical protein